MTNKLYVEEFSRLQAGDYVYVRPLEDIEEDGFIKEEYGSEAIFFPGDTFFFNKTSMSKFCGEKYAVREIEKTCVRLKGCGEFGFTRHMLSSSLEEPEISNLSPSDWQDMILCGCNQ